MIHSPICDMLGIRYPVFQGGMAWIADGKLAAAVSEAGGLGIIGAGNAPASFVREQIKTLKSLKSQPFGVNVMLLSPFADEVAQVIAEEKVPVVTTGAGNPSRYMKLWLDAGCKVIPIAPSAAMAKPVTRLGSSAVIAEGGESGGHVGELTTMVLVPLIRDATHLPVIAAGGIADGRGAAAGLSTIPGTDVLETADDALDAAKKDRLSRHAEGPFRRRRPGNPSGDPPTSCCPSIPRPGQGARQPSAIRGCIWKNTSIRPAMWNCRSALPRASI